MKVWSIIFVFACALIACNTAKFSPENDANAKATTENILIEEPAANVMITYADSTSTTVDGENNTTVFQSGNNPTVPAANRQLIRTAHVQIECKNFNAFTAKMQTQIKANTGWVEGEQETQTDYQRQNVLQIKVPVEKFDDLMHGISGLDGKLIEKRIESEDVTNAIVDTRGRIEAKKIIRARYLELLKQAKNMEDILEVQREINSITEDMESAAYNLQNMQSQAAYSTIYFTYFQTIEGASGIESIGFFTKLWEAVKTGGSGVQSLVVAFAALWPLWLLLAAVAIWWKRKRNNVKPAVVKASNY